MLKPGIQGKNKQKRMGAKWLNIPLVRALKFYLTMCRLTVQGQHKSAECDMGNADGRNAGDDRVNDGAEKTMLEA